MRVSPDPIFRVSPDWRAGQQCIKLYGMSAYAIAKLGFAALGLSIALTALWLGLAIVLHHCTIAAPPGDLGGAVWVPAVALPRLPQPRQAAPQGDPLAELSRCLP